MAPSFKSLKKRKKRKKEKQRCEQMLACLSRVAM